MRDGIPLTDSDRAPWLNKLASTVHTIVGSGQTVVLACSALKPAYRAVLRTLTPLPHSIEGLNQVDNLCNASLGKHYFIPIDEAKNHSPIVFVHLVGSLDLFRKQILEREEQGHHYMPSSLLKSQMDTLHIVDNEEGLFSVNAAKTPLDIVDDILRLCETMRSKMI